MDNNKNTATISYDQQRDIERTRFLDYSILSRVMIILDQRQRVSTEISSNGLWTESSLSAIQYLNNQLKEILILNI